MIQDLIPLYHVFLIHSVILIRSIFLVYPVFWSTLQGSQNVRFVWFFLFSIFWKKCTFCTFFYVFFSKIVRFCTVILKNKSKFIKPKDNCFFLITKNICHFQCIYSLVYLFLRLKITFIRSRSCSRRFEVFADYW